MSDRGGLDVGSAHGEIVIGSDLKGIDQAAKALGGLDSRTAKTNQALNTFAKTGAILGVGIAAGLGQAVRSFAGFENEMLAVKAVSGATGEEFTQLSDLAKQIGKDTVFSASQAASALEELAKAGVSIPDILNGAAAGATALAAAAGEGIPEAANQIATALNEFQLSGDQATRVADIFTNVSNKSAASAESFGEALKFVGTQAHTLGIPLEQTAAAIAALADAGLDGSTAGTSLNAALSSLVAPTEKQAALQKQLGLVVKDSAGNFVGLDSILQQLAKATEGLGSAQKQQLLASLTEERGARALNVLLNTQNTTLADGTNQWQDYESAMSATGTATDQAKIRLSGLSGSFEQLRGSIETAEIEFGENLAPAVKVAADSLTGLVNAFADLPEGLQTAIVGTAAVTGGLLLLGAAGGKAILIGRDLIGAWRSLGGAFADAQKGCSAASGCLDSAGTNAASAERQIGKLNLGLKALAGFAATAIVIEIAAKVTDEFGDDVAAAIDKKIADGLDAAGLPGTADAIRDNVQEAADAATAEDVAVSLGLNVEKHRTDTGFLSEVAQKAQEITAPVLPAGFEVDIEKADDLITELGITLEEAGKRAAAARMDLRDWLIAEADRKGIVTDEIAALKQQRDAEKKVTEQSGGLKGALQDQLKAQGAANTASGQSVEDLQAQADAEEEAAKEAADLAKQVDGLITDSLVAQGALVDLGGGFLEVDKGMTRVSDTIPGLVLGMARFGDIRLTKSNREALELERTLLHVEKRLDEVNAGIANNQEDMTMWAQRIGLVTDVLGGNTDALDDLLSKLQNGTITQEEFNAAIDQGALGAFTKLDALLAQGKISQDEYNAAKAAGIDLVKRSAGGIQDEDAELVQDLIDLDKYVKAHDDANGAVNRLTDEQKGFVAAMADARVQTFLMTLQLLEVLAATGAIPREKVTKYIVDSAQADPVIDAIAKELGLIEGDHKIVLTADNANQVLDDLGGVADFAVTLDGKTVTVHVETEAQALEFAKRNAEALDGKQVTFVIQGDDGPVTKTLDAVRRDAGQGVEVPLTLTGVLADNPDLGAALRDALGGGATATTPIDPPPPIPITAEDQTAAGVDSAKANVQTVSDVAEPEGEETGQQFARGLADAQGDVTAAADGLRAALNASLQAAVDAAAAWGNATGANFAVSFVNAVNGFGQDAYNAGFNLGFNAKVGAENAIAAHSPSRVAIGLALNFGGSFVDTLNAQAADARQAGFSLANAAVVGARAGFSELATRAVFGGDSAAFTPNTARGAGGGSVLNVGGISVVVQGANADAGEIANRARAEIVDGIVQLQSRRT